jgi:hypothetical protein
MMLVVASRVSMWFWSLYEPENAGRRKPTDTVLSSQISRYIIYTQI